MRGLLAVAAVALLAACGGGNSKPAAPTVLHVSGSMILAGFNGDPGHVCYGTGGYADIHEGAQVVAKDQSGSVIGASVLEAGSVSPPNCVLPFRLDVPAGKSFYSFEVSHRGAITYSADDLKAKNYAVVFTLG